MASLIDHPTLSERYFFPRPGPLDDAVMVTAADGVSRLACWRAAPHASADALTVLHFHGNGEIVADHLPELADALLDLGVNVLFAEYRGYGASTGQPTLGAILDDAEAVLAASGCRPARVVAFGRSLGSFCAIELAARHPDLGGVILDSSIADPLERILLRVSPGELGATRAELEADVFARLDHRRKLASYPGPLLVLHAAHDSMVPASHAERNAQWGGGTEKRLVLLPHGDHNSILSENRAAYFQAVAGFLGAER